MKRCAPAAIQLMLSGLLGAAVATTLPACTADHARDADQPLVVVSVLPLAFVVDRIAGGLVRVEVMIPPGASPATYEPAMEKLAAMDRAALYVKVGHPDFPFERAWLDRLLDDRSGLTVVDASDGAAARDGDPHVWLAPAIMTRIARNVHAALVAIVPDHEATLDENLDALLAEIASADTACAEILASAHGRRFFVFHPAWGYFADAYGLEQVAIEKHGKEPDAHHLGEIVERARAAGVEVVFAQPQMNEASAALVAEEVGARVVRIDPLAYEWSENLVGVARSISEGAVE